MLKLQFVHKLSKHHTIRVLQNSRAFVTFKPLQDTKRDGKDRRHKKEEIAADRTIQQAEAITETAEEVRNTCEFIKDTGSDIIDMTKKTTEKVTEAADCITGKAKSVWGTAKNTTEIIKDKIM